MNFDKPIPGQSLTGTPGNAPWESSPEYAEPGDALEYHMENLAEPERMEAILTLLESDIDVQSLVTGILRAGVMEGMHTLDVSLLIAPVIHEIIKGNAEAAGIEFKEGFEDEAQKQVMKYSRNKLRASKLVDKLLGDTEEEVIEEKVDAQVQDMNEDPEDQQTPRGLMSKPDNIPSRDAVGEMQ